MKAPIDPAAMATCSQNPGPLDSSSWSPSSSSSEITSWPFNFVKYHGEKRDLGEFGLRDI